MSVRFYLRKWGFDKIAGIFGFDDFGYKPALERFSALAYFCWCTCHFSIHQMYKSDKIEEIFCGKQENRIQIEIFG